MIITIPGTPVGKGRPKFSSRGGFVRAYTPKKTATYEELVQQHGNLAMQGAEPMQGPLSVDMVVCMPIPESWPKKRKQAAIAEVELPTTKPDIDNIVKGVFDALNGIAWQDDKQVVTLKVKKIYGERGFVCLEITQC